MRAMKGEASAKVLMNGFRAYYNIIRKHQALNGQTPAEEANLDLSLGTNKWLSLIRQSHNSLSEQTHQKL